MKKILVLAPFLLAGCQSLTASQQAQVFCALAQDGVTVAAIYTSQASAAKAGATSTVACAGATTIGTVLAN